MGNNEWLAEILVEYASLKGVNIDITRPVDGAELMMPSKDVGDETKICFYDFIEYLTSDERGAISMAITLDMPYFAEKARLKNKGKALARLEMELLNRRNEQIEYYLRHDKFEEMDARFVQPWKKRTGFAPIPTTLLGEDINECLVSPDSPISRFIIKMFKDKRFNEVKVLGEVISPWKNNQDNDGPKLN